jgi:hypothetical protein
MNKKLFLLACACLMLPSCALKQNWGGSQPAVTAIFDIPAPLGSKLLSDEGHDSGGKTGGLLQRYAVGGTTRAQLRSWYTIAMLHEGWQPVSMVDGIETVLWYEKPRRQAIITLRPAPRGGQFVTIAVSKRVSL